MAEKSFPLNDTEYIADDLQMWFAGRTHGVLCLENNLVVSALAGMEITLSKGHAFLRTGNENAGGVMYFNEGLLKFQLDPADALLDRMDAVVVCYDKIQNACYAKIQKGIPSSKPIAYIPKRDANDFEIIVAQIKIPHGLGSISDLQIIDTRLDENQCGLIRDNIERIPTQQLYNTFHSFMDTTTKDFDEWMLSIKDILNENSAAAILDRIMAMEDGRTIVKEAEIVPWSGIRGKPENYPPSLHNHDDRYFTESEINELIKLYAKNSETPEIISDSKKPGYYAYKFPSGLLICIDYTSIYGVPYTCGNVWAINLPIPQKHLVIFKEKFITLTSAFNDHRTVIGTQVAKLNNISLDSVNNAMYVYCATNNQCGHYATFVTIGRWK